LSSEALIASFVLFAEQSHYYYSKHNYFELEKKIRIFQNLYKRIQIFGKKEIILCIINILL